MALRYSQGPGLISHCCDISGNLKAMGLAEGEQRARAQRPSSRLAAAAEV